jgi:hypothetical protein
MANFRRLLNQSIRLQTNIKTKQKETDVMKNLLTILSILSLALFASCDKGSEDADKNKTKPGNSSQ